MSMCSTAVISAVQCNCCCSLFIIAEGYSIDVTLPPGYFNYIYITIAMYIYARTYIHVFLPNIVLHFVVDVTTEMYYIPCVIQYFL